MGTTHSVPPVTLANEIVAGEACLEWLYHTWTDDRMLQSSVVAGENMQAFSHDELPHGLSAERRYNTSVGHGLLLAETGALDLERGQQLTNTLVKAIARFPLGLSVFAARKRALRAIFDGMVSWRRQVHKNRSRCILPRLLLPMGQRGRKQSCLKIRRHLTR